jgi:hypothetical protein
MPLAKLRMTVLVPITVEKLPKGWNASGAGSTAEWAIRRLRTRRQGIGGGALFSGGLSTEALTEPFAQLRPSATSKSSEGMTAAELARQRGRSVPFICWQTGRWTLSLCKLRVVKRWNRNRSRRLGGDEDVIDQHVAGALEKTQKGASFRGSVACRRFSLRSEPMQRLSRRSVLFLIE